MKATGLSDAGAVVANRFGAISAVIRGALVDDDHAEFRRWSYSALVVVALHGAVATAAMMAWHVTRQPPIAGGWSEIGGLFIDLPPLASPEQTLPQAHAGSTTAAEPGANGPGADVPIAPLAQEGIVRDSGGGADASRAFAAGALEKSAAAAGHGVRFDPGPIDTSITVVPSLRQRREFAAFGRNRMILHRPVKHPARAGAAHNNPSALDKALGEHGFDGHGSVSRAPGAHIRDRVNAAIERAVLHRIQQGRNAGAVSGTNSLGIKSITSALSGGHGNAIGAANANGKMGAAAAGVINGAARNAIGLTDQVHPSLHELNVAAPREGIAALKAAPGGTGPGGTGSTAAARPAGILNGRGMARPGMSLTALGGAPKTVPGMLSGSDFRPKHQQ